MSKSRQLYENNIDQQPQACQESCFDSIEQVLCISGDGIWNRNH